jgi:hypothetical protein
VSPYADKIAKQQALVESLRGKPLTPMYSPEEAQARQSENQRDYALALAAQLSGDETMAPVGGTILKNALAARQQQVTEKGAYNPLTGEFRVNPAYAQERDVEHAQADLDKLQQAEGAAQQQFQQSRDKFQDQWEIERDRQRQAKEMQDERLRAQAETQKAAAAEHELTRSHQDKQLQWQTEDRLADDYFNRTKNDQIVLNQHAVLRKLAKAEPTAANNIAIIYTYMKMLDPNSVVREGEYATAQNAGGVPDKVRNMWNSMIDGNRINPDQVKNMVGASDHVAAQSQARLSQHQKFFTNIAKSRGLDADRIFNVGTIAPLDDAEEPKSGTTARGKPVTVTPEQRKPSGGVTIERVQ